MSSKADLHVHTNCSDGSFSPAEIVRKAKKAGLSAISICDHDTVDAYPEAAAEARELGIELIPGVELSSDIGIMEVHVLGYFVDIDNAEFKKFLVFFREERLRRAERMVNKLKGLGISITIDEVLEEANHSAIGRPHIASVLQKKGVTKFFQEAFNKYIGNHAPAYEKKIHISPGSAIKVVNDAGGLAVIAHPGGFQDEILIDIIESGADGIEYLHPSHNNTTQKRLKDLANQYFLLATGGSDYHGGKRTDESNFGQFTVPMKTVEDMRQALLKNRA